MSDDPYAPRKLNESYAHYPIGKAIDMMPTSEIGPPWRCNCGESWPCPTYDAQAAERNRKWNLPVTPGPACRGMLMIGGASFPCDWPTDSRGKHKGWAHANKNVQAIWGKGDKPHDQLMSGEQARERAEQWQGAAAYDRGFNDGVERERERAASRFATIDKMWVDENGLNLTATVHDPKPDLLDEVIKDSNSCPSFGCGYDYGHEGDHEPGSQPYSSLADAVSRASAEELNAVLAERGWKLAFNLSFEPGAVEYAEMTRQLCEAIRLTVEYVGTDMLPPIDGWSWYDALKKHEPMTAARFRKQWESRKESWLSEHNELKHVQVAMAEAIAKDQVYDGKEVVVDGQSYRIRLEPVGE